MLSLPSDIAPLLNTKFLAFFQDTHKNVYLQLELVAIVDWGEHFVLKPHVF